MRASPCRTSTTTRSTRPSPRRCCARSRRGSRPTTAATRSGLTAPLGSIDRAKLNIKGGSLALGHPFAATGTRIVSTLAKILAGDANAKRGLISVCTAGGMGVTAILER